MHPMHPKLYLSQGWANTNRHYIITMLTNILWNAHKKYYTAQLELTKSNLIKHGLHNYNETIITALFII